MRHTFGPLYASLSPSEAEPTALCALRGHRAPVTAIREIYDLAGTRIVLRACVACLERVEEDARDLRRARMWISLLSHALTHVTDYREVARLVDCAQELADPAPGGRS